MSTSLSKFLSASLLRFPDDACPAVEKVLSTGAEEPGTISRSIAMTARSELSVLSRMLLDHHVVGTCELPFQLLLPLGLF